MRQRTDNLGTHDFCRDVAYEACRDMAEFEIDAYDFCLDMNYSLCVEAIEDIEEEENTWLQNEN